MDSKSKIPHKELLTFSNLTNLDWHFVDIEGIANGRRTGDQGEQIQSTRLNDLLTPEVFVKYNAQSDTYSYPYLKNKFGENITLFDEEREQGLAEMRKRAGMAMEYLEKEGEDSFLGDWEVICDTDNYKLAVDFLRLIEKTSTLCLI